MSDIYKKIVELSEPDSPSTTSVTCFSGDVIIAEGETDKRTFVEIADCHNKIRLFKYDNDSWEDFIKMLRSLGETVIEFADYCVKTELEEKKSDVITFSLKDRFWAYLNGENFYKNKLTE